MKLVIQRVSECTLKVADELVSSIEKGLLVYFGVGEEDTVENAKQSVSYLAKKVANMRIFEDENGKMNLSTLDLDLAIMVVSQFTLYADTSRGNRPSFTLAANPTLAEMLYQDFIKELKTYTSKVVSGVFGEDMKINYNNDGPVTIIM